MNKVRKALHLMNRKVKSEKPKGTKQNQSPNVWAKMLWGESGWWVGWWHMQCSLLATLSASTSPRATRKRDKCAKEASWVLGTRQTAKGEESQKWHLSEIKLWFFMWKDCILLFYHICMCVCVCGEKWHYSLCLVVWVFEKRFFLLK